MAQAQKLSEQVKFLHARVRELEAALAMSRVSEERDDGFRADHEAGQADCVDAVSEAIGSLSLGVDGQAKYHGESAGSEHEESHSPPRYHLDLPDEILNLMNAFPFGFKDCPYNKSIFIRYLPHRQRAMELACVYYSSVAWMHVPSVPVASQSSDVSTRYDPISYNDFVFSIVNPIYGSEGYPSTDALHSHRLAVFFMVLANGNLYDESQPKAAAVAEQYYALARAAFSLDSILVEATCATVQALFLVFRFVYNSSQSDKEERWLLTGLTTRIAQTIGLQRDSAAWNLDPQEVQRRRNLFWELFVWESWSSLVHGRPGSLFIQHADCRYPEDLRQVGSVIDHGSLGFHAWKFRYSAKCMSMSIEHVFSTRNPSYSALLEIDEFIQKYPIPNNLRWPEGNNGYQWSSDPASALQQYCTLCVRDSNLLYIHRSYFAQAIREASDDPSKHRYKRSVATAFQVSMRLISVLQSLYTVSPLCRHIWFFWSGYFSSCVVLAALVIESPGCSLTEKAIHELKDAVPFFEQGSKFCRPPSVWNFLYSLFQRAQRSYIAFRNGQKPSAPPPSSPDEPDELEVVNGRQAVITTRSNPNSPSHAAASPSTLSQEAVNHSSPTVTQNVGTAPSVGYYPMDTSANVMAKPQADFRIESSVHPFEDRSYSSIGKALHNPMSRDSALPRTVPNSYVTNNSIVGVSDEVHPAQPIRDQAVIEPPKATWNYGVSHDCFPQQASPHQAPHAYLPYVHGHNDAVQSPHTGTYAYPPRPLQEPTAQNHDEIWRSFMMGYGP
ncbi:hypothetical protein J132_11368 [Termitomyces sp. J132]|nr:hypothetical protein J132_11368 [Termitomyces sp. J132]